MQNSTGTESGVRTYHPTWFVRGFALFFVALSAWGFSHFASGVLSGERPFKAIEIVGPVLFIVIAAGLAVHAFTAVVVLSPDAIEVRTLLSTKRIATCEIRGRREYTTVDADSRSAKYIQLEPIDDRTPALRFQDIYNFDSAFYEWLRKFPSVAR